MEIEQKEEGTCQGAVWLQVLSKVAVEKALIERARVL